MKLIHFSDQTVYDQDQKIQLTGRDLDVIRAAVAAAMKPGAPEWDEQLRTYVKINLIYGELESRYGFYEAEPGDEEDWEV